MPTEQSETRYHQYQLIDRGLTRRLMNLFNAQPKRESSHQELVDEIGVSLDDLQTKRTIQQLIHDNNVDWLLNGKLKKHRVQSL